MGTKAFNYSGDVTLRDQSGTQGTWRKGKVVIKIFCAKGKGYDSLPSVNHGANNAYGGYVSTGMQSVGVFLRVS